MSNKPFLTIGMATYDDFNGVYFSIMSHRLFQDDADCEFLVVDNNPSSPEGISTREFIESIQHVANVRYIPYTEIGGTSQPRNKIVEEARGDFVMITDPHVFLQPNGLHNLKKFLRDADPNMQKNLFTGPLLYDGMNWVATHFEPEWREQMLGVWATAWKYPDGTIVVCREFDGRVHIRTLHPDGLGEYRPTEIPWPSHEEALMKIGYKVVGMSNDDAPFEIPAQGFGLFVTSKEHWIPFNKNFRGFGGEEVVHHRLYRKHGRKTMCLPFMKWVHRFGRPGGPKYNITVEGKMRNYIIGFQELGIDVEPIRKHFVDEVGMSQTVWEYAIQDPINYKPGQAYNQEPVAPSLPVAKSSLGLPLPVIVDSFEGVSTFIQTSAKRDLDEHAPALISLASRCESAIEITKRRESTAFLLAGITSKSACEKKKCESEGCSGACNKTVRMHSFQEEEDTLHSLLESIHEAGHGGDKPLEWTSDLGSIQELPDLPFDPELLFLDTRHTGERATAELSKYGQSVGKYIVFHDTASHGQFGEDGKPGLLFAIRDFLVKNPDWFVYWHTNAQYGLTVLSRVPADKPKDPIKPWPLMDAQGNRCGCGQSLKASLKMIGIEATENCPCNAMAAKMDEWGPELCRQNIEEILDWLKTQAESRNMGHLYIRPAVRLMVMRAIKHAEKQMKANSCY